MAAVLHSAPRFASNEGVLDKLRAALGEMALASKEEHGEIVLGVERERIEDALRLLRDEHDYQQLVEMAGVAYPTREERFEVVYMLLSLTKNHRIMVKVRAAENTPPSAAKIEHSTKAELRMRRTSMPERRAASALPPTANSERPHLVRVSI